MEPAYSIDDKRIGKDYDASILISIKYNNKNEGIVDTVFNGITEEEAMTLLMELNAKLFSDSLNRKEARPLANRAKNESKENNDDQ